MRRPEIMRRVKARDTKPELQVRRALRKLGYPGYRLDRRDLPGRPDIVFLRRKRAIFVHGCFWHGHDCKRGARILKTNVDYWKTKIARNQARDMVSISQLDDLGWRSLTLWECQLKDPHFLDRTLSRFLSDP